jgi:RNA polymerase sigma factor (sigma-70 family)
LNSQAILNATIKDQTDEMLVDAFVYEENRVAVFSEIVKRYQERIYFHVRRIVIDHDDADDAAQNTFIKVWENLAGFRSDSKLFSWIYRIATNEALTVLRKRKPNLDIDEAMPEMGHLIENSSDISGDEIERKLQQALTTLPLKQKLVFCLKYFEELTYDQISLITGTSVGALKASYFHAVNKLEENLKRTF